MSRELIERARAFLAELEEVGASQKIGNSGVVAAIRAGRPRDGLGLIDVGLVARKPVKLKGKPYEAGDAVCFLEIDVTQVLQLADEGAFRLSEAVLSETLAKERRESEVLPLRRRVERAIGGLEHVLRLEAEARGAQLAAVQELRAASDHLDRVQNMRTHKQGALERLIVAAPLQVGHVRDSTIGPTP